MAFSSAKREILKQAERCWGDVDFYRFPGIGIGMSPSVRIRDLPGRPVGRLELLFCLT